MHIMMTWFCERYVFEVTNLNKDGFTWKLKLLTTQNIIMHQLQKRGRRKTSQSRVLYTNTF